VFQPTASDFNPTISLRVKPIVEIETHQRECAQAYDREALSASSSSSSSSLSSSSLSTLSAGGSTKMEDIGASVSQVRCEENRLLNRA
jgi:hypothetical protein